jgi:hypothetical protein
MADKADKVTSDSHAVAETDGNGQRHLTLVTDTGEVELVGDPQDVLRLVVEADRELNREDQQ